MAKLIPFSGTASQLYQSYGKRCFIGLASGGDWLNGVGVAGFVGKFGDSTHRPFFRVGKEIFDEGDLRLDGFVIV